MEKSSFFNSISKDRRYKAEDWARYFASFIGNGVFPMPSTGLQVVTGSAMTITVLPGKAWINGYFYENTSDLSLVLPVADGILKRIDRIVVRWDLTERAIYVVVKSSLPSDAPVAPTLQRNADAYELCLADVLVAAGATTISQAMITDQRLNPALCGVVAAVVNQIDTTAFNAQLQAWFQDYMVLSTAEFNALAAHMGGLKTSGDTEYSALETYLNQHKAQSDNEFAALMAWFAAYKANANNDFTAWFDGLKSALDENAATHLYNLVTALQGDMAQRPKVVLSETEPEMEGPLLWFQLQGGEDSEVIELVGTTAETEFMTAYENGVTENIENMTSARDGARPEDIIVHFGDNLS